MSIPGCRNLRVLAVFLFFPLAVVAQEAQPNPNISATRFFDESRQHREPNTRWLYAPDARRTSRPKWRVERLWRGPWRDRKPDIQRGHRGSKGRHDP